MDKFELGVPLKMEYAAVVEGFIDLLPLQQKGLTADHITYIKSVMNEAFVNVVEHTPVKDSTNSANIEFNLDGLALAIHLEDAGKGLKINDRLPPYPETMIGTRFPLLRTFDGNVIASVTDARTISLSFDDIDISENTTEELLEYMHDGGLGISIMTKTMDSVIYHYDSKNLNHLHLYKNFSCGK